MPLEPTTYRQAVALSRRERSAAFTRARLKDLDLHKMKEILDATAEAALNLIASRGYKDARRAG